MVKILLFVFVIFLIIGTGAYFIFNKTQNTKELASESTSKKKVQNINDDQKSKESINFDEQRSKDIIDITQAIQVHYYYKGSIPLSIDEISDDVYGKKNLTDPETKEKYSYNTTGGISYRICANFSSESPNIADFKGSQRYQVSKQMTLYYHKGSNCFDFDVDTAGYDQNGKSIYEPELSKEEIDRRDRDHFRTYDLAILKSAIEMAEAERGNSGAGVLCSGDKDKSFPCFGSSLNDGFKQDGSGWVKANLTDLRGTSVPILPSDPLNNEKFHYVYCADKNKWEINAILESRMPIDFMSGDQGDDKAVLEMGTDLNLIGHTPGCLY